MIRLSSQLFACRYFSCCFLLFIRSLLSCQWFVFVCYVAFVARTERWLYLSVPLLSAITVCLVTCCCCGCVVLLMCCAANKFRLLLQVEPRSDSSVRVRASQQHPQRTSGRQRHGHRSEGVGCQLLSHFCVLLLFVCFLLWYVAAKPSSFCVFAEPQCDRRLDHVRAPCNLRSRVRRCCFVRCLLSRSCWPRGVDCLSSDSSIQTTFVRGPYVQSAYQVCSLLSGLLCVHNVSTVVLFVLFVFSFGVVSSVLYLLCW